MTEKKEVSASSEQTSNSNEVDELAALRRTAGYAVTYEFLTRDAARLDFVLPMIQELVELGVLDETKRLEVTLAVQEAFTNAVEHGNLELESAWKEEPDAEYQDRYSRLKHERLQDARYGERRVVVHAVYTPGSLVVTVRDAGKGFLRPESDPSASADGQAILPYGRGLSLMMRCMDEVKFGGTGNEVMMVKILSMQHAED